MTKKRIAFLVISITIVASILLCAIYIEDILMIPARLLYVNDNITAKSDAIVCLSGAEVERVGHCSDLFNEKWAKIIIVTGGELDDSTLFYQELGSLASLSRDWLIKHGIPQENVILLPEGSNTYGESVTVRNLVSKNGYKTLIVVSSPYHMRRVSLVFKETLQNSNVSLTFSPSSSLEEGMGQWWKNEGKMISLFQEYIKLFYYLVKGYI